MEDRLRQLSLENDAGFEFPESGNEQASDSFDLCLVGTFLTDHPINFIVMKHRLASLWRPGRGLFIKDLGARLILFKFYPLHDLRWVMKGGPWTFEGHVLILHEMKPGEDPAAVPLFYFPFWLQVYDLPVCFFTEVVGKALANFIGSFISYDVKNKKSVERPYMRIRNLVDILL